MRHLRLTILLSVLIAYVNVGAAVSFTDSITGVTMNFPDSVEFKATSSVAYKKLEAAIPGGGYLSVYSVVNPKNEPYSWSYINNFDKSYGTPREKEKLSGNANGWMRIYDFKTDDGTPYVRCVTLVRGGNYAFYIEENAWSPDKLISKELVAGATFPDTIANDKLGGPRRQVMSGKGIICAIILIVLGILIRFVRNSLNGAVKIAVITLFGVAQTVFSYHWDYMTVWASLITGGCTSFIIYLLLYCPTWDDFWQHMENVFKHVGD